MAAKPEIIVAHYFIATSHDYLGEYPEALASYEKFLTVADTKTNQLEIEKVKLRLPTLKRQIQLGEGVEEKALRRVRMTRETTAQVRTPGTFCCWCLPVFTQSTLRKRNHNHTTHCAAAVKDDRQRRAHTDRRRPPIHQNDSSSRSNSPAHI